MKKEKEPTWAEIKKMFKEAAKERKELNEERKETDRQLAEERKETDRQLAEERKETDRQLAEERKELIKERKETDRQLAEERKELIKERKETDRQLAEERKETDRQLAEERKELIKERKETDRQLKELVKDRKETDKQIKETGKKVDKMCERIDRLGEHLGGMSNSNGDMAEEYFFNTLNRDKKFANETFDRMKRNISYDENDEEIECDILMINGKSTVLIEVKYNARVKNIKIEDLIKRANILKQIDMHKNHNIYLGVAAMSFNKKLAKELRQAGIATIHHTGKKMILYDKEVKVF